MSIYTLKRKSQRFKAPISGQKPVLNGKNIAPSNGFSLNGPLRNQGWVGQGVRGRSLVRTPFRGMTAMGAGGCCGTYKENIIDNSNVWKNDVGYPQPNVGDGRYIKRSNMNTPGLIDATPQTSRMYNAQKGRDWRGHSRAMASTRACFAHARTRRHDHLVLQAKG